MLFYGHAPCSCHPFFLLPIPTPSDARVLSLAKSRVFLFAFQSLLDDQGLAEVSEVAEEVLDALSKELYQKATELWGKAEMIIEQVRGVACGPACLAFPWG